MSGSLTILASGPQLLPGFLDGTAAVPGMPFALDRTTGLYRLPDGTIGFSIAGLTQTQILPLALAVDYPTLQGGTTTSKTVRFGAAGSDTNIGAAIVPKGTGALSAAVPDSTATGGNARGANAVDWQQSRSAATQVASGTNAAVAGGTSNTASNTNATVGGGNNNTASGSSSVVAGGSANTADGTNSWVPGGARSATRGLSGRGAWGSGRFAADGDAQAGEFVLRAATTDATGTRLTADAAAAGAANTVNLPNNGSYLARILVTARQPTTGDTAGWVVDGLFRRGANAAATALVGGGGASIAPTYNDAGAAAWRLTVAADTTLGAFAISGTGEAAKTIQWVARVLSVETVG